MAYPFGGKAIFSTRNGEYARREKIPSMRIILRSDPVQDQQIMVAKLQKDFPEACKSITMPVTDSDIYQYFDYCDAAVHGFEFLRAVLEYIARVNTSANAKKAMKVQDYVGRWKTTNSEAFRYIRPYHAVADLFTGEDIEEHGVEFLTEAMMQIKHLRMQEDDDEARQSALRLQMQHARMMQNQHSFAQLQAPARPQFPISFSATQGTRATSNPEHGEAQPQGGLPRHLPGPPDQFPALQGGMPLQRLTPSTEVLEHVYPGSTSRGDFHSDPIAHNAMDTFKNGYVAISSRGLPGPFNYQALPPPTRPVPLLDRVGTFDGNPPRGKKNPKKKSSDDARIVPNMGSGPRQASNDANPKRPFVPQHIRMPFYARSTDAVPSVQESHPSSGAVPHSGNDHHPSLPPIKHSSNAPRPIHYPPYHGQAPMQPAMEGRCRERVVSNPFAPPDHESKGPSQGPHSAVSTLPIPTNMQLQFPTAKGQLSEENAGFVSPQVPPLISQQLDPHAFGHQLPNRRMGQDLQNPTPEFPRQALAPMSNAGQPQFPESPGRSRANDTPRRPVQEGCTIWIGGIPNEFDKAALMDLLRPCRGLLDISEPKVSSLARNHINRSYAFADFQNPVDATEALERIPQTRFPNLIEGTFLNTNYPRPRLYASPGYYEHGNDGDWRRPASNISPTKSRKGEDSNLAGKSKKEHGRTLSKGSARGKKQSTSSSEGKMRRASERVIAADAGQKEPSLHSEEAIVVPDPHDTDVSMARVSQPDTNVQASKAMCQDPGVVHPDVGLETRANQDSSFTGDGAQKIEAAASAEPQVRESHQGTSSKHTEGRAKAPKKKSKGSNKLPVPENKGSDSATVQTPCGKSKPKAKIKPSANYAGKFLKDSAQLEHKGKQGEPEVDASKMAATTVPPKPTSTFPKELETPDQSFLGCNPTEDDGGQPNSSVAKITKPSSANDTEAGVSETAREFVVSAAPLEQSKKPTSQAMRRDISSPTQGSADNDPSILSSTAPAPSPETERSNSITQENWSPMVRTTCFVEGKLQNPTDGESGRLQRGPIEENLAKIPSTLLVQPSPSLSKSGNLRSPARKRAPSIPPRSSSLANPSTPIKTHQKKKPRNFTPVKEATPSRVTGASSEGAKGEFPVLTIDPTARTLTTDKSKDLPKPETPFVMDDGVRVDPPKISPQVVMDALNADQYYAQKNNHQVFHLGSATKFRPNVNNSDYSDSASTHSSGRSTPEHASTKKQNDIETTLREAGFRSLSGTSPFTIKDPELAFFETIDEQGYLLEDRTSKGGPVVSFVDDMGKITPGLSFAAWTKQNEMIEVVKKASAVKRLLACPPPLPWTEVESHRQQLSRLVTHWYSGAQEQHTTKVKAEQILKAKALLTTTPQRDSSTNEMQKWSSSVSLFMEENASELSSAYAQSRKPTTNSPSKSSRGTSSRKQQQERLHPILIKQPDPQTLARTFGRDEYAFQTANTGPNSCSVSAHGRESETLPSTFGCRTLFEEKATPSVTLIPSAALNQVTKLKDLFVEMENDRRRWSDDRHQVSTPEKGERMTISDPELKPLGGEFDMRRATEVKAVDLESKVNETDNELQQKPGKDTQGAPKGTELGSEDGKRDQSVTAQSDDFKDPTPAGPKEKAAENTEDPTQQEHKPQPLGVLFASSSSDSDYTISTGGSEEAHHNRPRGGHSPLKRSGYNAVAGRGAGAGAGGKKEGKKDPWALPQGEKPWGSGGEGRGEKKKRERE